MQDENNLQGVSSARPTEKDIVMSRAVYSLAKKNSVNEKTARLITISFSVGLVHQLEEIGWVDHDLDS